MVKKALGEQSPSTFRPLLHSSSVRGQGLLRPIDTFGSTASRGTARTTTCCSTAPARSSCTRTPPCSAASSSTCKTTAGRCAPAPQLRHLTLTIVCLSENDARGSSSIPWHAMHLRPAQQLVKWACGLSSYDMHCRTLTSCCRLQDLTEKAPTFII